MSDIARLHRSLKADLKTMHLLEDKPTSNKWMGKLIGKSQGIISSLKDTIHAVWNTKSLSLSTVIRERNLIQAAQTLQTMKQAMEKVDAIDAKSEPKVMLAFAKHAQRVAVQFENQFKAIDDADRKVWIKSEQDTTINAFKSSLDRLIQASQEDLDAHFLANLENVPSFTTDPNGAPSDNLARFKQELTASLDYFQKRSALSEEEIPIRNAIQSLSSLPKESLAKINRASDPVDKLNDLMLLVYDIGKAMKTEVGGDLSLPIMMHILSTYPEESVPLVCEIMTYTDDQLRELADAPSRQQRIRELDAQISKGLARFNALSQDEKASQFWRTKAEKLNQLSQLRDRLQSSLYVDTVLILAVAAIHDQWKQQPRASSAAA